MVLAIAFPHFHSRRAFWLDSELDLSDVEHSDAWSREKLMLCTGGEMHTTNDTADQKIGLAQLGLENEVRWRIEKVGGW